MLLKARVGRADETDAAGTQTLLTGLAELFLRMALMWVDGGDQRRFAEGVAAGLGWRVETVQHPDTPRWVVERTFAWLGRTRRRSKDDEALPASEEAWIYAASARLLLRRLAR